MEVWQPAWPNDPINVDIYVDGQFKAKGNHQVGAYAVDGSGVNPQFTGDVVAQPGRLAKPWGEHL